MKNFEHQARIINDDPTKTGLWLGCGTGKTRIALQLKRGSTLVICPKTQKLDRNWERECEKLGIEDNLHVVSKEEFRRDHASLPAFQTVIVDEAETCLGVTPSTRQRNRQTIPKASQLFEALHGYLERTQPSRLYLCTATITRSPMTVWAAGQLLGKDWNFFDWRRRYYTQLPMPGREVWSPKKDDDAKNALAEAVRSMGYVGRLEDFFDVPEQTFKNDYVDLTPEQRKRINEIKIEFPDPIVALGKRLQIENGVLNGDEYTESEFIKDNKLARIEHYAEEFPRMIVWAIFTNQIKKYEPALSSRYPVYTLTGATQDRESLFRDLRNRDQYILIVQAQISAGWELKECPIEIFASRTYSFSDYEQGLGRIQRTDAIKKNLYINLIARGGVDEAVHQTLLNKKDFSERVYLNI